MSQKRHLKGLPFVPQSPHQSDVITSARITLMNLYRNTPRSTSNRITPDMVIKAEIDYNNPENMRPLDGSAVINKKR